MLTPFRIVILAVVLCAFGAGWSWLDREGARGRELWQMRLLFLVMALAALVPTFGYPHKHLTAAEQEQVSEVHANERAPFSP